MSWIVRSIVVVVVCSIATACASRSGSTARKADPAVVAANKAKADAIMQTAQDIEVQGQSFKVGHSPDRSFALVEFRAGQRVNGFVLELAATRATGCDAVFEGGLLKFVPGITNVTPIPMNDRGRLRIETYCDGDARRRLTGLPDGRPGNDAQANKFANYPVIDRTFLSFSKQHGFQVSYYSNNERSWLWYPGNRRALPEDWQVRGREICYRNPVGTYNPATKKTGGKFACAPLSLIRRTVVADLQGDPFNLASGGVPYRLNKCQAPPEFDFDRNAVAC